MDIIALISAISVALIHGLFSIYKPSKNTKKIKELQEALKHSATFPDIDEFMVGYDKAISLIDGIADDSSNSIDRVLIFKAINGKFTPTSTTCTHEKRTGAQRAYPYLNYPIDDTYVGIVRESYTVPSIHLKTAKMPEGNMLKKVYEMEGVVESLFIHLTTRELEEGRAEIYYISLATHSAEGIPGRVITECELAVAQLRNFMSKF